VASECQHQHQHQCFAVQQQWLSCCSLLNLLYCQLMMETSYKKTSSLISTNVCIPARHNSQTPVFSMDLDMKTSLVQRDQFSDKMKYPGFFFFAYFSLSTLAFPDFPDFPGEWSPYQ